MSEHWKSTPKYWCKHCSTYVKDTPFEKKQHEATGKHQGNLRRFLQGIQKDHAKNERDKDKAKAEVERLNCITGAGVASTSSSSAPLAPVLPSSRPAKSSAGTLSAADQKRQWSQLAEMGIQIPDHARADVAMPGNWQTISRKVELESAEPVDDKLNIGIRKRKFEDDEEREEAGETVVRKGWGATTKDYPARQSSPEDLTVLLSRSITKKTKGAERPALDHNNDDGAALDSRQALESPMKTEPIEPDTLARLDTQDRERGVSSTTPGHDTMVKDETPDPRTESEFQALPAPVFKKRKAKQSFARKES